MALAVADQYFEAVPWQAARSTAEQHRDAPFDAGSEALPYLMLLGQISERTD